MGQHILPRLCYARWAKDGSTHSTTFAHLPYFPFLVCSKWIIPLLRISHAYIVCIASWFAKGIRCMPWSHDSFYVDHRLSRQKYHARLVKRALVFFPVSPIFQGNPMQKGQIHVHHICWFITFSPFCALGPVLGRRWLLPLRSSPYRVGRRWVNTFCHCCAHRTI